MVIDGINIKGITCDSRKVKEGFAFVAIRGNKTDGNLYINEAIKRGASIIFTESNTILENDRVLVKRVDNARKVLSQLCHEFYGFPSEKMKVIGVTGTNGKTSTSHLIYNVLRDNGVSVGLIGTLYIKINDKTYKSNLTTPDPEQIYYYMSLMVEEKVDIVVMEVSSHALESYRVYSIKFDIAIHTNIDRDHLNHHKTMENYILSKKRLFDYLPSGKIGLINLDDEHGLKLLDNNKNIVVITYGLNTRSTITASSLDTEFNVAFNYCLQRGLTTLSGLEIEPFEYPIVTNLIGKHNMYNALAAITSCLLLDMPIEAISRSIGNAESIFRRLEIIYNKEIMIIDDFCHNPSSYESVFSTVQNMRYKNIHIINAIRGNRGNEINKENSEVIYNWVNLLDVKNLFITSSRDIVSNNDTVSKDELETFIDVFIKNNVKYHYCESLFDTTKKALSLVEEGDILLLLGAQGMNSGAKFAISILKDNASYINNLDFEPMREKNNYLIQ